MTSKCLSILSLVLYTQQPNYENLLHLLFATPDYCDFVLNEVNSLIKASNLQSQYVLEREIKLVQPSFGTMQMEKATIKEREDAIEEKVENIMAMDIAILKFISTVPEYVEKNSFYLPKNVDVPYLVNELLTFQERQKITVISNAYEIYQNAQFNTSYQVIPKIDTVVFNNELFLSRIRKDKMEKHTTDFEMEHDYRLLVNFCNLFFENSRNRSFTHITALKISQHITFTPDLRQVLYAMSSTFSADERVHRSVSQFFNKSALDNNKNFTTKRARLTTMTLRKCHQYTNNILILIIYFMVIEDNNDVDNNGDPLPPNVEDYRNQLMYILSRMLEHLLEYIKFKARDIENYKIKYSQLPLNNIPGLSESTRPITFIMYNLQYALNFAPFLFQSL